jgi:FkbM family methyltransferase
MVDMGANKGEFTKAFLKKHPAAKIVMIEPDPFLAKQLTAEFSGRERGGVSIINAAIGVKESEGVPFYLSENPEASSLNKELAAAHTPKEGHNEITVRMTTLKEICSLYGLKKIDLLKMDIEGAEWELIEGLTKEDYKRIEQITVEFHDFIDPALRESTEKCIRILRKRGYLFVRGESTSYMPGSPYCNCLFVKKRMAILGFLKLRRIISSLTRK